MSGKKTKNMAEVMSARAAAKKAAQMGAEAGSLISAGAGRASQRNTKNALQDMLGSQASEGENEATVKLIKKKKKKKKGSS